MTKKDTVPAQPPAIPKALLDWLKFLYPDRHPGLLDQREADKQFGAVELIRVLESHYERQQNPVPERS